jgi:hypothetical protein
MHRGGTQAVSLLNFVNRFFDLSDIKMKVFARNIRANIDLGVEGLNEFLNLDQFLTADASRHFDR